MVFMVGFLLGGLSALVIMCLLVMAKDTMS